MLAPSRFVSLSFTYLSFLNIQNNTNASPARGAKKNNIKGKGLCLVTPCWPRPPLALALSPIVLGVGPLALALSPSVLALALVLTLLLAHRRFRLSTLSLGMIFAFLCVHEVGAHYTYSRVPYDQWSTLLTGVSVNQVFGLERNHYDRLVHLSYGLLLVWPMREVYWLKPAIGWPPRA